MCPALHKVTRMEQKNLTLCFESNESLCSVTTGLKVCGSGPCKAVLIFFFGGGGLLCCLTVCCHVKKARRLTGQRGRPRRGHPESFTDERFHSLLASSRQPPRPPPPPIDRQWTCLIKKRSDIRTCNFCEPLGGRRRDGGGGGGREEVRNSPCSLFFFLKECCVAHMSVCPTAHTLDGVEGERTGGEMLCLFPLLPLLPHFAGLYRGLSPLRSGAEPALNAVSFISHRNHATAISGTM